MSISPGWAVGWYFVPFANLVKPFHAMKEIWFASHPSEGGYEEKAPMILGWWWGLWIINNILGNIAFRIDDPNTESIVSLIAAVINIPLCIVLVTVMREVQTSQESTWRADTFA
jgi:hypothetical protein